MAIDHIITYPMIYLVLLYIQDWWKYYRLKSVIFFFWDTLYICLLCDEVFNSALEFSFTWVRHKGPPGPPKYEKTYIFFHILSFNLKISYQIVSLFDMYMDMGEKDSWKAK